MKREHPRTAPERDEIGARLCAKHQQQRNGEEEALEKIHFSRGSRIEGREPETWCD